MSLPSLLHGFHRRPARCGVPLSLAALATASLYAQMVVPVTQEPMHHVMFENQYVRVIDAALPAGQETLYHVHARDNVPIVIQGGRIAITPLAGSTTESDEPVGQVHFAPATYTHRISNLTFSPMRFIDVELLAPAPHSSLQTQTFPSHETLIDNDKVKVYRLVLNPGATLAAHAHAGPVLEVVVRGELPRPDSASATQPRTLRPGGFAWHEQGALPETSVGAAAIELIEIEWK
jgi:mannose-6-phosphate isomerase-like protein (cupin superfamily)